MAAPALEVGGGATESLRLTDISLPSEYKGVLTALTAPGQVYDVRSSGLSDGWRSWMDGCGGVVAVVLSLVYCQYYRPHVAISPEFRGRASDQSSDCWAPVSQCYSDQRDHRTLPPTRGTFSGRLLSTQSSQSSATAELCRKYRIFFLYPINNKFFERDFWVKFSPSKKFLRNSY